MTIIDPTSGKSIAGWSLEKLSNSWNTKHALAAYVPAKCRKDRTSSSDQYQFHAPWFMCEATDVWRLIRAIASGLVYYDPGHELTATGKPWVRPQWRIGTSRLEAVLRKLYARVSKVS